MSDLADLQWPEDAEAGAESGHGQLADVIASQLQRALAAQPGLGILREGCQAIDLLEDGEVSVGRLERLEAAEGLVVLVETPDDEFDGVVGSGDGVIANAVDQFGPVAFEEVKDDTGLIEGLDVLVAQRQHRCTTFCGLGRRFGVKDTIDLLFEPFSGRIVFGIIRSIDIFDVFLEILQSMKDAQMMESLREDPSASSGQAWAITGP